MLYTVYDSNSNELGMQRKWLCLIICNPSDFGRLCDPVVGPNGRHMAQLAA